MQLKTYLKKDNRVITDINLSRDEWSSYFVNIESLSKDELGKIIAPNDFYLEGAIYWKVNEKVIIDFSMWDLIDQLWAYLIHSMHEIIVNKSIHEKFYFPDQPIEVEVKRNNISFYIKVNNDGFIEITQGLKLVISHANSFFKILKEIFPDKYDEEIIKLKEMEKVF